MFPNKRLLLVLGLCAIATLAGRAARAARADDPKPGDPPPAAPDPEDETRGWVGYSIGRVGDLTPEKKKELSIEREHGVIVVEFALGSPAAKAGLKVGDVLLQVNGKDVPDTSKIGKDDKDAWNKFLKEEFKGKLTAGIKPGDTVTLVVDRAGRTETVKLTAVSKVELARLKDEAEKELQAAPVPDPTLGGTPTAGSYSFEGLEDGKTRPDDYLDVIGFTEVVEEEGAKTANHALRQHTDVSNPYEVTIVTGAGRAYGDVTVSTRFLPTGGEQSVSGGIAFRVRSWKNFYAAIADGVTKTLSIVVVKDGTAKVVATTEIPSFKLKAWHTLSVTCAGPSFSVTFDGTATADGQDSTFSEGWVGPCVRLDAETMYDDLKMTPAGK